MQKKFLLRISPELWDELERWAKDEFRSVNGQIEHVLRDAAMRRKRTQKQEERRAHPPGTPEEKDGKG